VLDGIQVILFDMGGTLVEYPLPRWPVMIGRSLRAALRFLFRSHHDLPPPVAEVPPPAEASARRSRAGPDTAALHRATVGLRRVVRAVSGRTLPRIAEVCTRPLLSEGRLYPETMPVLEALRSAGYRMGLVSNTPWGTPDYLWEKQVERFGLTEFFEVRLFSSGIGFRKPDPRIFRTALRVLGVRPEGALFVGDEPQADIEGARRAGLATVWLVRGRPPPKVHGAPADLWATSLTDLLERLPA
jgi:HAD superfamily hydrolase (TIGR01509 family)